MNNSMSDLEDRDIYKIMLENMDIGIYFVSKSRQITFWNKGAEEISGFSKDEVVGKFCYDDILSHVDEKGNKVCVLGCPILVSVGVKFSSICIVIFSIGVALCFI